MTTIVIVHLLLNYSYLSEGGVGTYPKSGVPRHVALPFLEEACRKAWNGSTAMSDLFRHLTPTQQSTALVAHTSHMRTHSCFRGSCFIGFCGQQDPCAKTTIYIPNPPPPPKNPPPLYLHKHRPQEEPCLPEALPHSSGLLAQHTYQKGSCPRWAGVNPSVPMWHVPGSIPQKGKPINTGRLNARKLS